MKRAASTALLPSDNDWRLRCKKICKIRRRSEDDPEYSGALDELRLREGLKTLGIEWMGRPVHHGDVVGLREIPYDAPRRMPSMVLAWHRFLYLLDPYVQRSLEAKESLPEEVRHSLCELSLAVFYPLVKGVVLHWIGADSFDFLSDIHNALSSSFLTKDYFSSTALLLQALLPFDPHQHFVDGYLARHCKRFATSLEPNTGSLLCAEAGKRRDRVLTAFYTRPAPLSHLVVYTRRPVRYSPHPQTGEPMVDNSMYPSVLVRRRAEPYKNVPSAVPAYCTGGGATPIRDVEQRILAYLWPSDLRACEKTCRTWAALVHAAPVAKQYPLHIGAFVRNRIVRFFQESWGDEHLNLLVWTPRRTTTAPRHHPFPSLHR